MTHRFMIRTLFAFAVGSSIFSLPAFGQSHIVKDGKAQAVIVVAENPAPMARLAAMELRKYVEKISGATLTIATRPDPAFPATIYLGRGPHLDRLKVSVEGLAHGAYRVASGKGWAVLAGPDTRFEPVEPYAHGRTGGSGGAAEKKRIESAWDKITGEAYANPFTYLYPFNNKELKIWEFDDAGTLNAVYDLLRGLGVRWYFPGELGEIVPKMKDIALPSENKAVRPDFPLRKLGWWSKRLSMTPEEDLWELRMGINHGVDSIGLTQLCHGSKFVHLREEFKKAHPKCLAFYGGKRAFDHKGTQGAPCLSSDFFNHHLKYARAVFDHFDEPMISIDVVDGYGRGLCQCELCKGKDTPERGWAGLMSDYVHSYVNRVATELYKSHPGKMVSALSYGAYKLPPENVDQFPPNLALWICQTRSSFHDRQARQQMLDLRKAWLEKLPSKKLFIYEYYLANRDGGAWEGIPVYFPRLIAEDLRSLKGVSQGEHIDLYQPHRRNELPYDYLAVSHLNLYVTTRLWWDTERDVNAMLEEYYTNFYGPARDAMKAFIEYCEQNWHRMRKEVEVIDKALELLTAARQAAGDTVYGKRIRLVVEYLEPLKRLRDQLAQPRDDVPSARALERSVKDLKMDGKLDDEFWGNVRQYRLSELQTGRPPAFPTTVWMAWSGDSLYLGIQCVDPDMKNLNIGTTKKDDPNVWSGDMVEALIETQFHAYYQIAISPTGAVTDLDRSQSLNTKWDSGAQIVTHIGQDAWTIEARIPAAGEGARDIDPLSGISGKQPSQTYPWYVNICRQRVRGDSKEYSAWSPTGTSRFNVPRKFGKVYVK